MENESILELDMTDWSRHILYYLIRESCERNISVNEIIVESLQRFIDENELNERK